MTSGAQHDVSALKGCAELLLLLAGLLFADLFVPLTSMTPSPFWVPVVLLTAQYGTMSGLAAAAGATAASLIISSGATQAAGDYYTHFLQLWRDPIWWFATALVLGGLIDRRVWERNTLTENLRRAEDQRQSIAAYCERLQKYAEGLEQRIALSEGRSMDAGLIALSELRESTAGGTGAALSRAVDALLGPGTRFSVLIHEQDRLVHGQLDPVGSGLEVSRDAYAAASNHQTLFQRMVLCRRTMSMRCDEDARLLEGLAVAAGPIVEEGQRVIGILLIEHTTQPMTAAIEVAVRAICVELSHLADATSKSRCAAVAGGAETRLRIVSTNSANHSLRWQRQKVAQANSAP